MAATEAQRRGRRIAMTEAEVDAFLRAEHTCRVATAGPDGPHVTPLWFIWDGTAVWLYSLIDSQRWVDLQHEPRIAIVVDAGVQYAELRGVEITGTPEVVGELPRTGAPHAELAEIERAFAVRYRGGRELTYDGRHGWLRVVPAKVVSWDFRKIPTG